MNSFEQGSQSGEMNNEEIVAEVLETQPEEITLPENTEGTTESYEGAELKPERALAEEKSIFERLRGKAREVAGVMMLMTALSAAPGFTQEAYAQETGRQPAQQEQVQEKTQEALKEFSVKEGDHEFTLKFLSSDVEKILDEQNIKFYEEDGSFMLFNEERPGGFVDIKFKESDSARTTMVEVGVDERELPGGIVKKNLKIKIYNSDGSIETISLSGGHIADYTKE